MKIVVAIPTIKERGDAWSDVAAVWQSRTCQPVSCIPSWAPGGWAAGLNEVFSQVDACDVFVCGSDDMTPANDFWLPAIEPYLEGNVIAPQVHDPRFSRWGEGVLDGDPVGMSSFPIMSWATASQVFPLPKDGPQHYYADNWISDRARARGIGTVAVPSCVIDHGFDERGRGAGMGSEDARMAYDREFYDRVK